MQAKVILYYNDLIYQPSPSFLFKDFGQVPYVLSQLYNTDLEYWISASNRNAGFDQFRGKRVRQFGKSFSWLPARFDALKNITLYRALDREAWATHLVIFPFTPIGDLMVARRAKRRWPEMKIIVKLDANRKFLEGIASDWRQFRKRPLRFMRQCHHYRELLRLADVVICETTECEQILQAGFLELDLKPKLLKAFSGLSSSWLATTGVQYVPASERRPSIVVSGRISSWQKYSELILEAGPPPGWTIDFVGEVDAELQRTIERYRATDPDFDQRYRFHGVITDKCAYFDLLMHARALLMNSRGGEGFPNVFAEAHYCGLFILSSNVSGAADATAEGRWGIIYAREDVAALRAALAELPERTAIYGDDPALDVYRRLFFWEHSLAQLVIRRVFEETVEID